MIEAPEALILAMQLNETVRGKTINYVIAAQTPHKFTWYHDSPESYPDKLTGKIVENCTAFGGMVEINISSDTTLLFCDGANLRYYSPGEKLPSKHQLLIGFSDESCLVVSVRMYGGLFCFTGNKLEGNFSNYYLAARTKPQVMSETFDLSYFLKLINEDRAQNKTAKAFLATEQTIPGLGNGVLQDILYIARIHPKTKIKELGEDQKKYLFFSLKKYYRIFIYPMEEIVKPTYSDKRENIYPFSQKIQQEYPAKIAESTSAKKIIWEEVFTIVRNVSPYPIKK